MLSTFCEVGGGFSILKKKKKKKKKKNDFRADPMKFPAFMRSRTHMSALS